tara:strand:- start:1 stop:573 length:573 start_codon:yes stop_codon:yes gene_type:complete
MFIYKNNYYLYIEDIKTLNLNLIKKRNKFAIIYRNNIKHKDINQLKKFSYECKKRSIQFFIANDLHLAIKCKADGLYLSSYNKKHYKISPIANSLKIIGSAHSAKEIQEKKNQGCKTIFLSRLFRTSYKNKKSYLGVMKFNLVAIGLKEKLVPLGGIRYNNLSLLNLVRSNSFAVLSEIKKKPAIIRRLF